MNGHLEERDSHRRKFWGDIIQSAINDQEDNTSCMNNFYLIYISFY